MTPWQESLSHLDRDYDHLDDEVAHFDHGASEVERPKAMAIKAPAKTNKPRPAISNRDFRVLLYLHQVLQSQREDEEAEKRSKTITKLEPAKFAPKNNSISVLLKQILLPTGKEGMHINDIIVQLERLGHHMHSQYHKYSQVHSALRRNSYMVIKIGKGKFRLRDGFLPQSPIQKVVASSSTTKKNNVPNLIDVAKYVIAECSDDPTLDTQKVWSIMDGMGYDCNYKYLQTKMREHKIVLKPKFKRPLARWGAND
jgi:hypothetical protein